MDCLFAYLINCRISSYGIPINLRLTNRNPIYIHSCRRSAAPHHHHRGR
ncbi:hypothetical protein HanXRQr2_Chr04g0157221 [Helianthus annuus]|uniref:Uncharacterized protein n=1 Tax=Helianthus annuus TaxID=4232 RepID=A0A9K3J604_HELAN|nr:hypothetical protein HanXRQr2_Chr04g0157221 [Helianthus annuus]